MDARNIHIKSNSDKISGENEECTIGNWKKGSPL